jgi:hypothetical protein
MLNKVRKNCIIEIRKMINVAKNNVMEGGMNNHNQFEYVYNYMQFASRCGLLKEKILNILWKELQEATGL